MTVGPSAGRHEVGVAAAAEHRERHPPDVARRRRVGRVEVAVRIEPGDRVAGVRSCRAQAGHGAGMRRAVAAEDQQARSGAVSPTERRRDEVALARQELADRRPVLGPRVRIGPEARFDRQVAGIAHLDPGETRRRPEHVDKPKGAQPGRRELHPRQVAAECGGDADDGDRCCHGGHGAASWARAHRRLRPRALFRPLGVRGRAPAVRLGRPGLPDGRAARARRRRDPRPVGRARARLHRIDRPSAPAPRDRGALRDDRGRRGPDLRRRRGGDLLPRQRAPRAGRPRDRDLAGLPEPLRGRPCGRGRRDPPRAPRERRLGDRHRPAACPGDAGDPAHRRQHPAQPDRDAGGSGDLRRARRDRRGVGRAPAGRRGLSRPRVRRVRAPARPAPTRSSGASRSG